jgi:hypothetical protein
MWLVLSNTSDVFISVFAAHCNQVHNGGKKRGQLPLEASIQSSLTLPRYSGLLKHSIGEAEWQPTGYVHSSSPQRDYFSIRVVERAELLHSRK